jgi:hypothetical protein
MEYREVATLWTLYHLIPTVIIHLLQSKFLLYLTQRSEFNFFLKKDKGPSFNKRSPLTC